jgi:hypothetical protein
MQTNAKSLWPGLGGALGVGQVRASVAPDRLLGLRQDLPKDTCLTKGIYKNLRESIPGSCGLEICVTRRQIF